MCGGSTSERSRLLTQGEAQEHNSPVSGGRLRRPDHASPEQVAGNDITIGSHVCSLGVLLFESRPERPYRPSSGRGEALKKHRRRRALRPSQAVQDPDKAHARADTPGKLCRDLKGDLDTIVVKTLSKAPRDRYPTADAFAQDLGRHSAASRCWHGRRAAGTVPGSSSCGTSWRSVWRQPYVGR